MAKETRKELLQGVETCWHDYTAAKMGSVCLGLNGSFHGILESGHNYQRHRGDRQAPSLSKELGDLHDQNNRALETCKGCRTKAGSAGGEGQQGCRLDVIRK